MTAAGWQRLGRGVAAAVVLATASVRAGEGSHKYNLGERVDFWVNKVGPYHNPQETYEYYDLPFCKPVDGVATRRRSHSIGEQLEGHELVNSGYKLFFTQDVKSEKVCTVKLSADVVNKFTDAVVNHYWYQLYLDDLPIWGMVGEADEPGQANPGEPQKYIYTHRRLNIAYNGPYIIEVNMTSEHLQPLKEGSELEFTYEVLWEPTTKSFENRFDRYLDYDFFRHQIHWFSIFNSTMMVIFLCGLVSLILFRTLRNDYARYSKQEDDGEGPGLTEDSGWKQVHGDVFRAPMYLMAFSALYGVGWQLVVLVLTVVLYAMAGPIHGVVYEERGELATAFIACYALTCAVAGYASGSYYRQYFSTPRAEAGSQWQKAMLLTVLLFPTVVVCIVFLLNVIAEYYDTTHALHLSTIFKMFAIWLFVSFPLTVVGTMFGRHWSGKADFPCRVNSMARPIPLGPWYTSPWAVILATGILPFGSIFIEMYFIFTSFWNYKFYFVYGFMLLVYLILIIVSVCTTIVATYFVLNAENYHWQWISFLASGSTAFYVFLYSVYYFWFKTKMSGLLQTSFYFGYMFLFCFGLFLLVGSVGVAGSTLFVKKIYTGLKID